MSFIGSMRNWKWKHTAKVMMTMMVGASLLLSGCGGGGDKKAASGGSGSGKKQMLTIGMTNAPRSMNPVSQADIAGMFVTKFMYDSLLGEPEPYKFTSHLAESFETKDKQTFTIKLNPKAKWSDGKPLTADDVVFSINLVTNPKCESSWNRYLKFIEGLNDSGKNTSGKPLASVVKKDATTIEIKCKRPMDPNFVKDQLGFNFLIFPKHIFEKIDPAKISASAEGQKPTVFSGPFKLVKYVTNDHVEMEANKDYVRGTPKLKKIFVKIQNGTNMVVDLKAGKTQMAAGGGIGKLPVKDIEVLKKEKKLVVKNVPSLDSQLMEINNTNPEFNLHFRLAMVHAIDRKRIVDQLYKGYSYVNPTIYTKPSPVFDASIPNPAYSVDEAKKELAASGYDVNKPLTLLVPIGNVLREQSADLIQQDLQKLGLKVTVQKMDFPTLMSRAQKGDYQLLLMGLGMQADPDYSRFYEPGSPVNFSHVDDKKLTKMMQDAAVEADSAKRVQEYKEIQKYLADNQFHIALYGEENFIVQSADLVGGLKPYWHGSLDDLHEWHFK